MDLRQAFEDILREYRYDSHTRLMYADCLEEHGFDDEAVEQRRRASREWIDADKWMHDFAQRCGYTDFWERKITYEDCIQAGHDYINKGDYFIQTGEMTAQNLVDGDFWVNWSIVTGSPVGDNLTSGDDSGSPFTCSC